MTEQLETRPVLVNVETGELLEPTLPNIARVLNAARTMKQRLNDVVAYATSLLVEESARQGTKTLREEGAEIVLSGGLMTEYDLEELRQNLEHAGCPTSRIDEAIVATVTYKVNRSVLRQLGAANPEYQLAIQQAAREIEKPYSATVKKGPI